MLDIYIHFHVCVEDAHTKELVHDRLVRVRVHSERTPRSWCTTAW
jgi:hypothetical protein